MIAVPRTIRGLFGMLWPGRRTFSQFGEDIFIEHYFVGQREGTRLDIGAFHPRVASNTMRLRRRGWRGVNVDGDEVKVRLFRWFRRGDINVRALVAGPNGGRATLRLAEGSATRSYGSMDRLEFSNGATLSRHAPSLKCSTTSDSETWISSLLMSKDWRRSSSMGSRLIAYIRRCLASKSLDLTLDGVRSSDVTTILQANGYEIVGWHPPSVFFGRERLTPNGR